MKLAQVISFAIWIFPYCYCLQTLICMRIKNFQVFKMDLEKPVESEIKLPTSIGSQKKQENSINNIYFCFTDYAKTFDCVNHKQMWKILTEMGIPDHLTCLLRNLYAGQEATVRNRHGTMDWFQIGKGVYQGCILSPCLFNLYTEYITQNAGWMKHKLESKLPGGI